MQYRHEEKAATTARARPVTRILQAYERIKLASPASGPGWSVSFRDAQDHSVAVFTLSSYVQLQMLVDEVGPLGYALTVLDDDAGDADFVFRETSTAIPDILSAAASPPKPAMPVGSRGPIGRGDLVMQDCGGPIMLVIALSSDLAYCVWFAEQAAVHSGTFTVTRLVNVSSAKRRLEDVAEEVPASPPMPMR